MRWRTPQNQQRTDANAGDKISPASSSRITYRLLIGATTVLLALVVTTWILIVRREKSDAPSPSNATTKADAMESMRGMAGMSMDKSGAVALTAAQLQQFGVTFATVDVRPLTSETRTTGIVTVDETTITQVAPKFSGFIDRLYVNATGQPVRRGQPLLDIYSPDLVAAQHELLTAAQLQRDLGGSTIPGVPNTSTNLVAAARRRLELWDISDSQIDAILQTARPRRTLTLYAPQPGVVLEKKVVQGQAVMPGETLYTIANLSTVWIDIQVREQDMSAIKQGSSANVQFAGLSGRTFTGRIAYVYPMLDSLTRTIRARVVLANQHLLFKPGMYATVQLRTPMRSALSIPTSAILRTGDRNIVFVDMGVTATNHRLMPRDVELGTSAGDYIEVLAGLEPGQRVVTSAQFLLDSESNLGDVMKAMMSNMGASDMDNMGNMSGMGDMPGMDRNPPASAPRR